MVFLMSCWSNRLVFSLRYTGFPWCLSGFVLYKNHFPQWENLRFAEEKNILQVNISLALFIQFSNNEISYRAPEIAVWQETSRVNEGPSRRDSFRAIATCESVKSDDAALLEMT